MVHRGNDHTARPRLTARRGLHALHAALAGTAIAACLAGSRAAHAHDTAREDAVSARPPDPLTHAWVQARTRSASPRIRALTAGVEAARARVGAAAPLEDPMVMLRVWDLPAGLVTRAPGQTMLMAQQSLPLSAIRARREDVARAEARETELARDAAVHATLLEVDLAYIALWEAVARATLADAQSRTAAQQAALVATQVARGAATPGELARVQVLVARAELAVRGAAASGEQRRASLGALLDLPAGTALTDPPAALVERPPPTLDALTHEALATRAESRYGEAARARATALEGVARAADAPVLTVGAGAMVMPHEGVGWMLETGLTLPIWRDARRARRDEAAALTREADAAEDAWRVAIAAEVARAWGAWHAAHTRLEGLRERVLPAYEARCVTERAALATGAGALTVLDAERELLDVHGELIAARADLLRADREATHAAGRSDALRAESAP